MTHVPLDKSTCGERGKAFLSEFEQLCEKHSVRISLGSYDSISIALCDLTESSDAVVVGHSIVWDSLSEPK